MPQFDLLQAAATGTDFMMITLTVLIIIIMAVFVIWFIWFFRKFEHKITIRKKTKGNTDKIIFDKYRYVKKKGEAETIQLWSTKEYKPTPPDDAKDFTKKGKEYVECYESDTGEFKYIEADEKLSIPTFTAIDTDDKEFYANAFVQAQKLKRKGILEFLTENIGLIIIVLIFLITLAFWEEITLPMIKVSEANKDIAIAQAEILENLESIIRDRQYIPPESVGRLNQTPPD